jgi:hypothetical protein
LQCVRMMTAWPRLQSQVCDWTETETVRQIKMCASNWKPTLQHAGHAVGHVQPQRLRLAAAALVLPVQACKQGDNCSRRPIWSALGTPINTHHSALSTQHAARATQHAARSTQPSARGTRHRALSTQHSALSTQHSALITQHSALGTQHSALSTLHSALSTQHSALSTQHSALSTQPPDQPVRDHSHSSAVQQLALARQELLPALGCTSAHALVTCPCTGTTTSTPVSLFADCALTRLSTEQLVAASCTPRTSSIQVDQ